MKVNDWFININGFINGLGFLTCPPILLKYLIKFVVKICTPFIQKHSDSSNKDIAICLLQELLLGSQKNRDDPSKHASSIQVFLHY